MTGSGIDGGFRKARLGLGAFGFEDQGFRVRARVQAFRVEASGLGGHRIQTQASQLLFN